MATSTMIVAALSLVLGSRCEPTGVLPRSHARIASHAGSQAPPALPAASSPRRDQHNPRNARPVVDIEYPDEKVPIYKAIARTIGAKATDPDGFVRKVIFFADGKPFGEDETEPYQAPLIRNELGSTVVQAMAVDDEGATGTSARRTYTVQECPSEELCEEELGSELASGMFGGTWTPIVHWIGPKPRQEHFAGADVTLEVEAKDKDGEVAQVEFFVNDELLGTIHRAPYRLLWRHVATGTYRVTAKAIDNMRAPGFSSVNTIVVRPRRK